jgi:hypothetical protein
VTETELVSKPDERSAHPVGAVRRGGLKLLGPELEDAPGVVPAASASTGQRSGPRCLMLPRKLRIVHCPREEIWTNRRSEALSEAPSADPKVPLTCLPAEGVGFGPTGSLHSQGFSRASALVAGIGCTSLEPDFCDGRLAHDGLHRPELAGKYGQLYGHWDSVTLRAV